MSFGDLWSRTLVYFGIAEEDDYWDEDGYATEEELERSYADRPNVRRLSPRRRDAEYDDWTSGDGDNEPRVRTPLLRSRPRPVEALPSPPAVQVHLVVPRSFNDAQQIADKFKQ